MTVREETSVDRPEVHAIHCAAFGRREEADLVDALRSEGVVLASLVAEAEHRLAGHILFSRMWIDTSAGSLPAASLAPLAVLPEFQRRGVGSELVQYGLDLLRKRGERIVIVLGDPCYYSRFGFSSGKARFFESPFPPEAFMALELNAGSLPPIRGKVRYPAAFRL